MRPRSPLIDHQIVAAQRLALAADKALRRQDVGENLAWNSRHRLGSEDTGAGQQHDAVDKIGVEQSADQALPGLDKEVLNPLFRQGLQGLAQIGPPLGTRNPDDFD